MSTNKTIVLIYGLPGSGKTTLAEEIYRQLNGNAVWFNADKVRSTLSSDLGFSDWDRGEQARRMGCLASLALDGSEAEFSIVDFVNPTLETFEVFMKNVVLPKGQKIPTAPSTPIEFVQAVTYTVFSVFMDTIRKDQSRFADTSALFNDERQFDFRVDSFLPVEGLAQEILFKLKGFQNGN